LFPFVAMPSSRPEVIEQLQRMVAALVATQPAGTGLCLVGGFRYRLLDQAVRRSVDIDYHWPGAVLAKQRALAELFERRLLSNVRRRLNLEGSAHAPAPESATTAVVELAFWRLGSDLGRIEIPVDVIQIECLDPPTVRTADGVVYLTVSDADMFESKVIAVISRGFLEHRDLVDLYLFINHAAPDTASRLARKCASLGIGAEHIARRLADLAAHSQRHAKAVDRILQEQLDPDAAAALAAAGGGQLVMATLSSLLESLLKPYSEDAP
jgi:CRP-like cAMP-binding protein